MSKKRRRIINCEQCGHELEVKRSLVKVASHPLFIKGGRIQIHYSEAKVTEKKEIKLWLKCSHCSFLKEFKDEDLMLAELGILVGDKLLTPVPVKQKHNRQENNDTLPEIVRPSKFGTRK
jgi:hypothetical protein